GRAVKSLYRGVLSLVVGSQVRSEPVLSAVAAPEARRPAAGFAAGDLRRPYGGPAVLPAAPRRRWRLWPWLLAAWLLFMCVLSVPLSYVAREAGPMSATMYRPPAPARGAAKAAFEPWRYPGAEEIAQG